VVSVDEVNDPPRGFPSGNLDGFFEFYPSLLREVCYVNNGEPIFSEKLSVKKN
jgi:hypothetical protein